MSAHLPSPKLAYAMLAFASMFWPENIVMGRALHADFPIKVQAAIAEGRQARWERTEITQGDGLSLPVDAQYTGRALNATYV